MSEGAAQTAVGPVTIVAIEQNEPRPLLRDELARRMLPARVKPVVALTRWGPARRWMASATDKHMPGLWASMLCRKRYVEDRITEAAEEGLDAVVILGAGFDTCAYRLPSLARIPVFEVDQPENIARKRARLLKLYGRVPEPVRLVPVDFETQALPEALADHGYRVGQQRTFFVCEAVTQYLTDDAVRATFGFLGAAPPGSRMVFTYVRKDFLDGTALYGAEAAYREYVLRRGIWTYGMHPDDVPAFLDEYGWEQVKQVGPAEFASRYLAPTGRALAASEVERSVFAVKR
ncbi:SAM-dependent methyltransferase [Saccharopolyspora erythraea]|uniref:SAM-dependent methyltransferase n=1 Tax=Saccharopolyspora erythraea TaxID=1836 RepID=UPI001BAB130B|nr:SAM-dependent methyltransferase [Saccharopolyspora erythraea]QUH03952.1 SAM-dependent methyltransferase [Saccharopolyspora erythraea]